MGYELSIYHGLKSVSILLNYVKENFVVKIEDVVLKRYVAYRFQLLWVVDKKVISSQDNRKHTFRTTP